MDSKTLSVWLVWTFVVAGTACAGQKIPNTHVDDNAENREILDFVEKYRKAVEARDAAELVRMASVDYFDDMGTPSGEDDVDFETLKAGLARLREEVIAARYQISYRGLTQAPNKRVLVDLLYTGWFKVDTPDGPQWRRRLEPHRIVLTREGDDYKIVSGM